MPFCASYVNSWSTECRLDDTVFADRGSAAEGWVGQTETAVEDANGIQDFRRTLLLQNCAC